MKENYLEKIKAIQEKAEERQSVHCEIVKKYHEDVKDLEKEIEKQLPPIGTVLMENSCYGDSQPIECILRGCKIDITNCAWSTIFVSKKKKNGDWSKIEYYSRFIIIDNIWDCLKK